VHTLWLLRHAKTVADPPPGGEDFDRVLAPRGRRDADALGELIGKDGHGLGFGPLEVPGVALVSPAERTRATAERALPGLHPAPRTDYPDELYGADPEDVLELLRALGDDVGAAVVVGHNPTMHALAAGLLAPGQKKAEARVARDFPTCALGIYAFDVAHWSEVGAHGGHLSGLIVPPFRVR
jgi:phosphohistidine phosphatase